MPIQKVSQSLFADLIKTLRRLKSDYSPNFGNYNRSVFDKCLQPMTNVTYLEFSYDRLKIFPNLTQIFPNLQTARLSFHFLNLSHIVRKPTICICKNKDADQLRGNREADQRLCFRYTDSTLPLLLKSEISSF